MEITKTEKKFKVTIEEKTCLEEDEVIDDLCDTCRLQLREFFHPTEPALVLLNADKVRKEVEEDFWATHDPSGGDLPPEDDENDEKSVGGGMKWIPEKTKAPARQQGEKKEIDKGKIMALHKAGWSRLKIAEEMRLSYTYTCQLIREMMAEREREGED